MQNTATVSGNIKIITINAIHMHINERSCNDLSRELKDFSKVEV